MLKRMFFLGLVLPISLNSFCQLMIDSSYADIGFFHSDIFTEATSVDVQSDGKVLVSGEITYTESGVLRLNQDGKLDNSFNSVGYFKGTDIRDTKKVISLEDNKLLLIGTGTVSIPGGFTTKIKVIKLNEDGTRDVTFGNNGIVVLNSATNEEVKDAAVNSEGKIVIAGYVRNGINSDDYVVFQLNEDGSYDTTFDSDGYKLFTSDDPEDNQRLYSVALQNDDKIVLGGDTPIESDYVKDVACFRLNLSGEMDKTFSGDGKYVKDFGGTNFDYAGDIKIQDDGKIVFLAQTGGWSFNKLSRLNSNGSLDNSFLYKGPDYINKFEIYDDGFLAMGESFLTLINNNGSRNSGFGNNGVLNTTFGSSLKNIELISSSDYIYIVGQSTIDGNKGVLVYRLATIDVINNLDLNIESSTSTYFYPNPFTEKLNVFMSENGVSKIKVYNTSGQLILSSVIENGDEISYKFKEKGVYYILIENENNNQPFKLIKH